MPNHTDSESLAKVIHFMVAYLHTKKSITSGDNVDERIL